MSALARSLLALVGVALLQAACAARRNLSVGSQRDSSVSLGKVEGSDIVNLPQIHIGVPDVIVTFPNDCDPYGYLHKDLLGTQVIVSNSLGGAPPFVFPVDPDNPQSDVEVHCQNEFDDDNNLFRCPGGLDVNSYQFCRQRLMAN